MSMSEKVDAWEHRLKFGLIWKKSRGRLLLKYKKFKKWKKTVIEV